MNDLAELTIDDAVFGVLPEDGCWVPINTVLHKMPDAEADVKAALDRLQTGLRIDVRTRFGNSTLIRRRPQPGQEPAATPLPEPAPAKLKYFGSPEDKVPPSRERGERLTLRPQQPARAPGAHRTRKTADTGFPVGRREATAEPGASHLLQPRTTKGDSMHDHDEIRSKIKKALQGGPLQLGALTEKVGGVSGPTIRGIADRMFKAREIHRSPGRTGAYSLNGAAPATSPSLTPSGQYRDQAELHWSVGCDGTVTFKVGHTAIEIAGEVLERVNRARQAIAKA